MGGLIRSEQFWRVKETRISGRNIRVYRLNILTCHLYLFSPSKVTECPLLWWRRRCWGCSRDMLWLVSGHLCKRNDRRGSRIRYSWRDGRWGCLVSGPGRSCCLTGEALEGLMRVADVMHDGSGGESVLVQWPIWWWWSWWWFQLHLDKVLTVQLITERCRINVDYGLRDNKDRIPKTWVCKCVREFEERWSWWVCENGK